MLFFFNDTATTEIYTLSIHDALPILSADRSGSWRLPQTPDQADPLASSPRRPAESQGAGRDAVLPPGRRCIATGAAEGPVRRVRRQADRRRLPRDRPGMGSHAHRDGPGPDPGEGDRKSV